SFERAKGEIAIVDIAVEEVFGVIDNFTAVLLEIADGFGDDVEVFLLGDTEGAADVQVPAFAEDGDDGRGGVDELADVAVLVHRVFGEAGGSEGRQFCVPELQTTRPFEE